MTNVDNPIQRPFSTTEKTRKIPLIESDIFKHNDTARFAIGKVAVGSDIAPGLENEFYGAAELRSRVYLDKGWVTPDALDERGTELDLDDERSIHFAILERTAIASLARVVGNMRLIVKGEGEAPLPLEAYYPELFADTPAPAASTEVSRLIGQHEDRATQAILKWPLFIAGLKHVEHNGLGPVYGLLEPNLARGLAMQGVPVNSIAEAKYIEAINASKQPVEIDVPKLGAFVEATGDFGIDLATKNFSYLDLATSAPLYDGSIDIQEGDVA